MSYDFTGKIAVVTGASSGLGEATAIRLAGLGMTVVAVARREERLEALAAAHAGIVPRVADVVDTDSVDALVAWVTEEYGACHVLVNNAGVGGGALTSRGDLDDALRTIDINLQGVIRCMLAFADLLESSAPARVVNIASVAGKVGIGPAAYAASKFGVVGLSESLSYAWASRGISVCSLNPGFIETEGFPQTQVKRSPIGRFVGQPEMVAEAVEEVIRSGKSEKTVPRWYAPLVTLRHVAPPVFRAVAGRMDRAGGSRD
ncbi:SDR family oxidoreductase [Euzebya pacifica]|uniref:SDR family NAD(P)-dependent oxidoreductase n=1 Tax=Euzebya pacifica TaxID=1608957 RepID=UPI0030FA42B3